MWSRCPGCRRSGTGGPECGDQDAQVGGVGDAILVDVGLDDGGWRLTEDGEVYLIEANPNPQLSYGEDFAESAHHAGIEYEPLLQRIVNLGLRYRAQWRQQ